LNIRLGTFNCENLFFRYRLLDDIPKPFQKRVNKPKPIDFKQMADGFKDISDSIKKYGGIEKILKNKESIQSFINNAPNKSWKSLLTFMIGGSFIDRIQGSVEDTEPISHTQRSHTAMVIYNNEPNFVGVQEIESLPVLKQFYHKYISKYYKLPYEMLIDGNDNRGIDVGLLNNDKYPVLDIKTHQFDRVPGNSQQVFSRDCLEVDVQLRNGETLTIYINHLKSQIGGGNEKRLQQATRIREIIRQRFGDNLDEAYFVVMGDLNCGPSASELEPLLKDLKLTNPFKNLDRSEQWSHLYVVKDKKTNKIQSAKVEQLDYILLSPGLAKNNQDVKPILERRGLVYYDEVTQKLSKTDKKVADVYKNAKRFAGIAEYGTEASDHCGIFIDLDV